MGDIHFMLDETDKRILSILAYDGRIWRGGVRMTF